MVHHFVFLGITLSTARRLLAGRSEATAGQQLVGLVRWLAHELVVFGMSANPEPLYTVRNGNAQSAISCSNPDAPILPLPHLLEVQGQMRRVLTK